MPASAIQMWPPGSRRAQGDAPAVDHLFIDDLGMELRLVGDEVGLQEAGVAGLGGKAGRREDGRGEEEEKLEEGFHFRGSRLGLLVPGRRRHAAGRHKVGIALGANPKLFWTRRAVRITRAAEGRRFGIGSESHPDRVGTMPLRGGAVRQSSVGPLPALAPRTLVSDSGPAQAWAARPSALRRTHRPSAPRPMSTPAAGAGSGTAAVTPGASPFAVLW